MKITNVHKLPEAIVRAVSNDPYRSEGDITVTQLISPPMIRYLQRKHEEQIIEDVSDRIWLLIGQLIHSLLHRAESGSTLVEERIATIIDGWKVTGQFDLFDGETLFDFKVTSVWAIKEGVKLEWRDQLNYYAYLLYDNGFEVNRLQLITILRDWRQNEALKYGSSYPQQQVKAFDVLLLPFEETWSIMRERIKLHKIEPPPICTPEERWDRPRVYAVHKEGRKTALKLCSSEEQVCAFIEAHRDKDKLSVQIRPEISVRCLQYCSVRQFCEYGKTLVETATEENEAA